MYKVKKGKTTHSVTMNLCFISLENLFKEGRSDKRTKELAGERKIDAEKVEVENVLRKLVLFF